MSTSFQQSPDIFLNAVRTNNLFHYFSFSVNNHCIWNAVYLIFISKNRLRIRITDICPWHVIKSIDGRFFLFMGYRDMLCHNDADMLSSHISLRNTDNWDWCWWSTLTFDEENRVEESRWVKSFNPVYRISNRALVFLDRF